MVSTSKIFNTQYFLFVYILLLNTPIFSQDQYYSTHYNKSSTNFSYNLISDLILDQNQHLWIATPNHLVSYNGINFKTHLIENKNRIISIQKDGENRNTILFSDGKIYKIEDINTPLFQLYKNKKNNNFENSHRFVVCNGYFFEKLIHHSQKFFYYFHKVIDYSEANYVLSYYNNRIIKINNDFQFDTIYENQNTLDKRIFIHNKSFIIFNENQPTLGIEPLLNKTVPKACEFEQNMPYTILEKGNQPLTIIQGNKLWVLQLDTNYNYYWKLLTKSVTENIIYTSIAFSNDFKTIYLGSQTEGLFIFRKKAFNTDLASKNPPYENYYLQLDIEKIGTITNGGLIINKNKKTKTLHKKEFFLGLNQYKLNDTFSLVSEFNHILKVNKFTADYAIIKPANKGKNTGFVEYHNEILLLQLDSIFAYNPKTNKYRFYCLNDAHTIVNKSLIYKNNLWIAHCNGITIIDLLSREILYRFFLNNCIRELNLTSAGIIASSYGTGLFLIQPESLKVVSLPLDYYKSLEHAHSVYFDSQNRAWISSNTGLLCFQKSSLLNAAGKSQFEIHPQYFTTWDGLITDEFNGGCDPAYIVKKDGTLSYPSIKGFVQFKPYLINTSNPVKYFKILKSYTIADSFINIDKNRISLPYSSQSIKLQLQCITDKNPKSLQLYYHYKNKFYYIPYDKLNELEINITHEYWDEIEFYTFDNDQKKSLYVLKIFKDVHWLNKPLNFLSISILILLLLYAIIKIRTRAIKNKNIKLQELIDLKIEEIKLVNFELQEKIEKLTESNEYNQLYISVINHDIYAPIKFINIIGDHLNNQSSKEELLDNLQLIVNSTKRLQVLCSNILKLISSNEEIEKSFTEVNIFNTINNIHQFFTIGFISNKNSFQNNIPNHLYFVTNENIIEIILTNLISNSLRFTQQGTITASAHETNEFLEITISDTGDGIPDEIKHQLNQKNYKITNKNSIEYRSYGFGYNLIFKLLPKIKADILIEDNLPIGTSVTLKIYKSPLN